MMRALAILALLPITAHAADMTDCHAEVVLCAK